MIPKFATLAQQVNNRIPSYLKEYCTFNKQLQADDLKDADAAISLSSRRNWRFAEGDQKVRTTLALTLAGVFPPGRDRKYSFDRGVSGRWFEKDVLLDELMIIT